MALKHYEHTDGTGVVAFAGIYSHVWDLKVDAAVVSVVEAALPGVRSIIGGDLPPNIQGLLGSWSWVSPETAQLCLLMDHARNAEGYFIGHEVAHLLHYSRRPDLFSKDRDIRGRNLTEMIAHAGGLLFAPFAHHVRDSLASLEELYKKMYSLDRPFLDRHVFSSEDHHKTNREHRAGYKAARFIISKGLDIKPFVDMDVSQAEQELARFGYLSGLHIEPKKRKQAKAVEVE